MKQSFFKVSIYSFTIETETIAEAIRKAQDMYNSMGMITRGYLTTFDGQVFQIH